MSIQFSHSPTETKIDKVIKKLPYQQTKQQFIQTFAESFKDTTIDTDNLIRHFLLAGVFIADGLFEAYNTLNEHSKISSQNVTKKLELAKTRSKLTRKTKQELQQILNGIEILPNLNKDQLVELILSNQAALQSLKIEERKSELNKMTNSELRILLKGVDKVSRLKKSQMVDLILSKDKLN